VTRFLIFCGGRSARHDCRCSIPAAHAWRDLICEERDGDGWLVLARDHGWLHGSRSDALEDAAWLASNPGFPIRELGA
jgi:hypothetical protein